jgi:hypothetical protein
MKVSMNIDSLRICGRHKCVEGSTRNDGSLVTFNARKRNGKPYVTCDQCTEYKNNVINPKVSIILV